jgi:ABC-type oligopeptide transport system substrate-binding subunit
VDYADRLLHRRFDLAGPARWTADYPDPQDWLDQFQTSSGANAGRWQDPLYDQLVALGDQSLDAGARALAYRQAQLEIGAGTPAAFLDQPVAWVLVSPRVLGLTPSPLDPAPVLGTIDLGAIHLRR